MEKDPRKSVTVVALSTKPWRIFAPSQEKERGGKNIDCIQATCEHIASPGLPNIILKRQNNVSLLIYCYS